MPSLKSTILWIDTEAGELATRRRSLEAKHYEVLTAVCAKQALELFLTHFIDAVIIGEHAEGIEADVVCARMKQAKPHVPIMLLSAYGLLPETALKHINAFVYQGQPEEAFLASLDRMLNLSSGFFSRWLDNWRFKLTSRELDAKSKKVA